jgi:hypothetical protein
LPSLALDTRFPAGMTLLVYNDERRAWEPEEISLNPFFQRGEANPRPFFFQQTALAFTLTISGLICHKQIQCQQRGISLFF